MNRTLYILTFFLTFLLAGNTLLRAQYDIPAKPELQTSVYDYENLLSSSEKQSLEEKLIRYSDSTSTQIVLIIISSTQGENINYLGAQWGQKWGIGQEKEDNGVLILLAQNDKRIAINTGYGVEHLLTDALSKRIIETVIIPEFKKGNFYQGLDRGIDVIFQILAGAYTAPDKTSSGKGPRIGTLLMLGLFFLIFLIIIAKSKGNRGGGSSGGTGSRGLDLMDIIILSNMGKGGFGRGGGSFGGGGGFGGGGFGGGFGGGGFGGGGASGGW